MTMSAGVMYYIPDSSSVLFSDQSHSLKSGLQYFEKVLNLLIVVDWNVIFFLNIFAWKINACAPNPMDTYKLSMNIELTYLSSLHIQSH